MSIYFDDTKVIVKRVTDFGSKPRSARQALIQAHAFLVQEGQWVKGEFFLDGDPREAYEKASCNSWSACAMGALGLVTGEMPIAVTKEWREPDAGDRKADWIDAVCDRATELGFDQWLETVTAPEVEADYSWSFNEYFDQNSTPVSFAAAKALAKVIDPEADDYTEPVEIVINLNDVSGRTAVLNAFEQAIKAAGGEPIVKAKKPRKTKVA